MRKITIVLISIFLPVIWLPDGRGNIYSAWTEAPPVMVLEEEYLTSDPRDYRYSFPEYREESDASYRLSAVTYQAEVCEYVFQEPSYVETGQEELRIEDPVVYYDRGDALLPNDMYAYGQGTQYVRKSSSLEAATCEVEREVPESIITYEGVAADGEIPPTRQVEIRDPETGRKIVQEIPLDSHSYQNYRWVDDFWFPITFSVYDAKSYYLGKKVIPYDNEHPALEGCESELLEVIGKTPENYTIENFEWDGEPYRDEMGVMHRNAVGRGSRRIADCYAVYRGEKEVIPISYTYHSVYRRLVGEKAKFNVKYKIKATGIYEKSGKIPADNQTLKASRLAEDYFPSFSEICGGTIIISFSIFLFSLVIRIVKRKGNLTGK